MTEVEQAAAPQNGIDLSAAEDDDNSKSRPADIEQDMREMERRKRVEAIMGSKLFREELERIVDSAREGGTTSGILQQLSDIVGIPCTRVGSVYKASNCMMPVNDIRGVESMGYAKGEKILRCKLAATFRLLDLFGWTQGLGAQITARLKVDQEYFLVNPYGMMYHEITASSLNKVDMQGQIVEQGTTNFGVNKSHFMLHSIVHAARPDIRCAIYIGCSPVVAVSSLRAGILPLTRDACVLGEISTHAYTGSLVGEERDKLVRNLGPNSKVMLLSNHGALCCGETIEEAFYAACHIVQACETQLKLLPVGLDNLVLIPEESRKQIYEQSRRPPEDLEKKFAAATTQQSVDDSTAEQKDENVATIKATGNVPKWRVGGAEFEALMRMMDNAGYRTGYIYRHPLVKSEPPKPKNDVELPPAVSSLGYLLEEEELFKQGIWKKGDIRKGGDRSRWLNSPNVYQKVEVLETGTPDPKKITKWVAEGSPTHSTPVRIEDPLQFVPVNTNPKEFKRLQQQIKDNRRADKISAGPQSQILDGVTWDEASRIKDATVSQSGDHVVLMGAASKGIIQRGFQHNAAVYKAPYAKNPFDNVTDDELNEYKRTVERKKKSIHGEYTDTDFSESEALSSQQTSGAQHTKQTTTTTTAQAVSQSEPEDISEHQVMRIETQQAPVPSQPEVVLSDASLSFINGERSHTAAHRKPPTGREQNKNNFNSKQDFQELSNANNAAEQHGGSIQNLQNLQNSNTPDKLQALKDKLLNSLNNPMQSISQSSTATTPTMWQAFVQSSATNTTTSNNNTMSSYGCSGVGGGVNMNGAATVGIVGTQSLGFEHQHNYATSLNNLMPCDYNEMSSFQQQLTSTTEDLTANRYFMPGNAAPPSLTQSCNNLYLYGRPTFSTNPFVQSGAVNAAAMSFAAQSNDDYAQRGATASMDCFAKPSAAAAGGGGVRPHAMVADNAYKKSIFCRNPQMCDYVLETLQRKSNDLIYNIPFRTEAGGGAGSGSVASSSATYQVGGCQSPHRSRCTSPSSRSNEHKRRHHHQQTQPSSPYRTVSHFGFNSPQRQRKPDHKHIPVEPPKYVPLRRSCSYEEIFSSPRYVDLCESCFERLVRFKPEFMQIRSRLRNIFDLMKSGCNQDAANHQNAHEEEPMEHGVFVTEPTSSIHSSNAEQSSNNNYPNILVTTENELYTTALEGGEHEMMAHEMPENPLEQLPLLGIQLEPVIEEDELLLDTGSSSSGANKFHKAPQQTSAAASPFTGSATTFIGKILEMNFTNESTNFNYAATTPHTISSNFTIELERTEATTTDGQIIDITMYSASCAPLATSTVSPQPSVHSLHSVRECTNFLRRNQDETSSQCSSPSTISLNHFADLEQQLLQETNSGQPISEIIDFGNWPEPLPLTDEEELGQEEESSANERQIILSRYLESNNAQLSREERIRRKLEFNNIWNHNIALLEDKLLDEPTEEETDEEHKAETDENTKDSPQVPTLNENNAQQRSEDDPPSSHSSSNSCVSETFYGQTIIQRKQLFEELPALNTYPSNESNLDAVTQEPSQHSLSQVSASIRNQLDGIDMLLKQAFEDSDSCEGSLSSYDGATDSNSGCDFKNLSSGVLNVIIEESEEDEDEQEHKVEILTSPLHAILAEAAKAKVQAEHNSVECSQIAAENSSEVIEPSMQESLDKNLQLNLEDVEGSNNEIGSNGSPGNTSADLNFELMEEEEIIDETREDPETETNELKQATSGELESIDEEKLQDIVDVLAAADVLDKTVLNMQKLIEEQIEEEGFMKQTEEENDEADRTVANDGVTHDEVESQTKDIEQPKEQNSTANKETSYEGVKDLFETTDQNGIETLNGDHQFEDGVVDIETKPMNENEMLSHQEESGKHNGMETFTICDENVEGQLENEMLTMTSDEEQELGEKEMLSPSNTASDIQEGMVNNETEPMIESEQLEDNDNLEQNGMDAFKSDNETQEELIENEVESNNHDEQREQLADNEILSSENENSAQNGIETPNSSVENLQGLFEHETAGFGTAEGQQNEIETEDAQQNLIETVEAQQNEIETDDAQQDEIETEDAQRNEIETEDAQQNENETEDAQRNEIETSDNSEDSDKANSDNEKQDQGDHKNQSSETEETEQNGIVTNNSDAENSEGNLGNEPVGNETSDDAVVEETIANEEENASDQENQEGEPYVDQETVIPESFCNQEGEIKEEEGKHESQETVENEIEEEMEQGTVEHEIEEEMKQGTVENEQQKTNQDPETNEKEQEHLSLERIKEIIANEMLKLEANDEDWEENDEPTNFNNENETDNGEEQPMHSEILTEDDSLSQLENDQEDYEDYDDDGDDDIDAADDDLDIFRRRRHKVLKKKNIKNYATESNDHNDTDDNEAFATMPKANPKTGMEKKASTISCCPQTNSSDADDERGEESSTQQLPKQKVTTKKTDNEHLDLSSLFELEDTAESTEFDGTSSQGRYIDSDRLLTGNASPCQLLAQGISQALDYDLGNVVGAPRRTYTEPRLSGGGCALDCKNTSHSHCNKRSKEDLIQLSQQIALDASMVVRRVREQMSTAGDCCDEVAEKQQRSCMAEQEYEVAKTPSNDGSGDGIGRLTFSAKDETFFRDSTFANAEPMDTAANAAMHRADIQSEWQQSALAEEQQTEVFDTNYCYDSVTHHAELKFMAYCTPEKETDAENHENVDGDELMTYNVPLAMEEFEIYSQSPSMNITSEEFENTFVTVTPPPTSGALTPPSEKTERPSDHETFFNTLVSFGSSSSPKRTPDYETFDNTFVSLTPPSPIKTPDRESFENTFVSLSPPPPQRTSGSTKTPHYEEYRNTVVSLSPPIRYKHSQGNKENRTRLDTSNDDTEYFNNTSVSIQSPRLNNEVHNIAEEKPTYLTSLEQSILKDIDEHGLAQDDEIFEKIAVTIRNKFATKKSPKVQHREYNDENENEIGSPRSRQQQRMQHVNTASRARTRTPLRTSRAINILVSNSSPDNSIKSGGSGGAMRVATGCAKKRNFILENIRKASNGAAQTQRKQDKQQKNLSTTQNNSPSTIRAKNHPQKPQFQHAQRKFLSSNQQLRMNEMTDVFSFQSRLVRGSPSFWVSLCKTPPSVTPRSPKRSKSERNTRNLTPRTASSSDSADLCQKDSTLTIKFATTSASHSASIAGVQSAATHVENEIAALGAQIDAMQPRLDTYKCQIDSYGENIASCVQCIDECIELQHDIAQQHQQMRTDMRLNIDIEATSPTYAIDATDD